MKPIFITEAEKQKLLDEFQQKLAKMRMFDGKLSMEQSYEYKEKLPKAVLWYTPKAWIKMISLVDSFTGEVGWHGSIERVKGSTNEYVVKDIFVYPQTVTGAHVDTDEEEYHDFIMEVIQQHESDPDFCLNFHGHSHVNMAVSPSGTDISDQKTKMEDQKTGFYVFTIQNKQRDSKTWIYDYDNNIAYMPEDVEIDITLDESIEAFIQEAHDIVIPLKTTTYSLSAKKTPMTTGYPKTEYQRALDALNGEYGATRGGYPYYYDNPLDYDYQ